MLLADVPLISGERGDSHNRCVSLAGYEAYCRNNRLVGAQRSGADAGRLAGGKRSQATLPVVSPRGVDGGQDHAQQSYRGGQKGKRRIQPQAGER